MPRKKGQKNGENKDPEKEAPEKPVIETILKDSGKLGILTRAKQNQVTI